MLQQGFLKMVVAVFPAPPVRAPLLFEVTLVFIDVVRGWGCFNKKEVDFSIPPLLQPKKAA
jgi:hypothetical protein